MIGERCKYNEHLANLMKTVAQQLDKVCKGMVRLGVCRTCPTIMVLEGTQAALASMVVDCHIMKTLADMHDEGDVQTTTYDMVERILKAMNLPMKMIDDFMEGPQ